ncbi:MAG: hypothetical protein NT154_20965, partial [Verrucomicrobia bacterium]|nr:hypothetical protein [Verrucomicrobiota bacterium]
MENNNVHNSDANTARTLIGSGRVVENAANELPRAAHELHTSRTRALILYISPALACYRLTNSHSLASGNV